jgi:hypothetical protein
MGKVSLFIIFTLTSIPNSCHTISASGAADYANSEVWIFEVKYKSNLEEF